MDGDVVKKSLSQDIKELGWYPLDPAYRKRFNEVARDALAHARDHGDVRAINGLLSTIESKQIRQDLQSKIANLGPLVRDKKEDQLKLRKRREFTLEMWPEFSVLKVLDRTINVIDESTIKLGSEYCSVAEFVEDVADIIALNRRAFTQQHLATLGDAILKAVKSNNKRKTVDGNE